ncbi:hypothetical protein BKA70DRAFT_356334 [Coprinopsis sp. MPI-PUGE-AT-0042]|nr:hypothetical protein BKA70DRAFT_356334 [Coprinopsis sp. MPI-PUGE-AT-0042]
MATSEAFQTTGDWHAASNNSAYLSTLLTTSEVGDSSMRFEFLGTEIVLFGKIFSGRGGSGSVAVSCSVDGTPVEGLDPPDGSDWYKFACAWKGDEKTADGSPHIFFLNATVPELSNTAFSIDSVRYLPAYDSDPVLDEESVVEYKKQRCSYRV